MNRYRLFSLISLPLLLSSCSAPASSGFHQIDYEVESRDRYENRFGEDMLPEQWEDYGVGDPYILRFNGEYYLYSSTKNYEYGYKVWKTHDLLHYEYLGLFDFLNQDGSKDNQDGQYAPEVYYWNGDFYAYGSPSGRGHYIYKSETGLPYGNFKAVTGNLGLNIDGSVFIDDDETMTFLTSGDGAIRAYEMNSMTSVKKGSMTELLSPLIKQTEGPFMVKHDGTYYLTYTGNSVKSAGYRIAYSYSESSPFDGFVYPNNNPIVLNTIGDFNGLGHSSTVLGPNLDSYYLAYHNLEDQSGPKRALDINRVFFGKNRMSVYGPTDKPSLVPLMPDYVEYDSSNLNSLNGLKLAGEQTSNRFTAEYNFASFTNSSKLVFAYDGEHVRNYIEIDKDGIYLYINNELKGEGSFNNTFDFTKYHSVRLAHDNGHFAVYFDNMKKIDVNGSLVNAGYIGYQNIEVIGTTTFTNEAFNSSSKKDPKAFEGTIFADDFIKEVSNLNNGSEVIRVDRDEIDYESIYSDTHAVKLINHGDYVVYPIDVLEDSLYGIELTYLQSYIGSQMSVQIDNNDPFIFTLEKSDYSKNMNSYEDELSYVKKLVAEVEITKGLHTLKIELVHGSTSFTMINAFKDSKYCPDYQNDLSTYVSKGATYLSLWKLETVDGYACHKAKAGANNMILFGEQSLTDYEVSIDIKVDISAATNAMAGLIVRCNNPSLYTGYVDQSAQGYFVGFNRLQLVAQKINYDSQVVGVNTGDQYTLGEWHTVKVIAKDNMISVYFDGAMYLSYVDANPYNHGLIALYSVNTESYYKNLVIKGI